MEFSRKVMTSKLRWFSGGKERSLGAVELLGELSIDINHQGNALSILPILEAYKNELSGGTAVPYVLSRMNVELSNHLMANNISLTSHQEELFRELRKMSQIRYGF